MLNLAHVGGQVKPGFLCIPYQIGIFMIFLLSFSRMFTQVLITNYNFILICVQKKRSYIFMFCFRTKSIFCVTSRFILTIKGVKEEPTVNFSKNDHKEIPHQISGNKIIDETSSSTQSSSILRSSLDMSTN